MKTNYECTAYFRGIDGRGACDDECQWWKEQGCVCAKGNVLWDGKEYHTSKPTQPEEKKESR